jgi:hypothetical protein
MLFDETDARIHQLAIQIADDAARADIEIECPSFTDEGYEPATLEEIQFAWYDTALVAESAARMIRLAVTYLTLRGKIVHHPFREGWIQVKNWRGSAIPPMLK